MQLEKKKYDDICRDAYAKAPLIVPSHSDWLDSPWKGRERDREREREGARGGEDK